MLRTQLQRFGLALAVGGFLLLVIGVLYGDVTRLNEFWRFVGHNYRRYNDGASLVFYGFWLCALGLFLWLGYPSTLGRLVRWIRAGARTQ